MRPIISIYTPVYNSERYLSDCIKSVLNQTCKNFEWYIYDDGSTDRSYGICLSYAQKDSRIKLFRGNNGTSITMLNQFLEEAKGDYIAFIDNDDYWDNDYLTIMLDYLKKTKADCAISSYTLVDSNGKQLNWYTPAIIDGEIIDKLTLKRKFLTSLEIEGFRWNKIYKTKMYQNSKVRMPNEFPGDIPFEYNSIGLLNSVVMVNNKGYNYRQSSTSQVGAANVARSLGMLKAFTDIGNNAINEGLLQEGLYYKSWRYVNFVFNDIKKLSRNDLIKLFQQYPWKSIIGKNLFETVSLLNRYPNKKDGRIKFIIKTFYVWLMWKKLGNKNE